MKNFEPKEEAKTKIQSIEIHHQHDKGPNHKSQPNSYPLRNSHMKLQDNIHDQYDIYSYVGFWIIEKSKLRHFEVFTATLPNFTLHIIPCTHFFFIKM